MSGRTLPGIDDPDPDRIVFHVDMDCFYASCERLREPALRGEPVIVGMGYEPGETFGAVATASYEARDHGVESAQPISQALEALPRADHDSAVDATVDANPPEGESHGHYRPVDLEYYQSVAAEIAEILTECADVVRKVSIDEAYLDVTDRTAWRYVNDGSRTLAEGYARHVKGRIAEEVGVPASVGVAPNMSAAKVAADHDKPDGLVVVEPGAVASFLAPLSVEVVHGIGPVTADRLADMGVDTAADLAAADPAALREAFGSRGPELRDRARGVDDRAVTPTGRPKSLSRESAFAEPADDDGKRETVSALASDVAARAGNRGAMYRTIGIKVVVPPYDTNTRERSLSGPVDAPDLVEEVALELLSEFEGEPARKVGVRVSNLSFASGEQARLAGWDTGGPDGVDAEHDGDRPASGGADADRSADASGPGASGQSSLDQFDTDT
ncbi:DNA polymerase IV [Halobellus salinus]|uniref:DNA polymerase IV n=1 Tax=Halobellus salinus TaxID=931585 RepID=A0A830EML9_9EURY|nr:DNA polymerase IV [Halobellus salinus]GGI98726.1 DNA polymerase IV [Halobellus salinus]SMP05618.1 DNA polymerase IV (DinB-like DNA polymerase) [Halobellus salinus]